MIRRTLRLCAMLCLLVGSLALLPMAASAARSWSGDGLQTAYQEGTVPGTVPTATPTHKPKPTKPPKPPKPTATAVPHPTSAPSAPSSDRVAGYATVGGDKIEKVIGDRLSPVIYGFTASDRLYWSPDNGLRWRYATTRPAFEEFIMSSAEPAVLYNGAGIDCTMADQAPAPFARSDFRGTRWEELPRAVDLVPYLIDPADPYRLFAADCELPFFSGDGGETWIARPDSRTTSPWFTFRVKDMVAASLIESGDGADAAPAWHVLYAGGALDSGNSVIAYSEDEGVTWTTMTPTDGAGLIGLGVLEADPYVAGRLWAADAQGVWYTEDFGANWLLVNDGLERVVSVRGRASLGDITDLAYAPATGQLFLASTWGLYVLAPGETVWQPVLDQAFSGGIVNSLLITESNPSVLWVNARDGAYRYRIR